MRRRLVPVAALLVALTGSAGAAPGPGGKSLEGSLGSVGSSVLAMGRSVGSPTAGHLVGGSRLPDEPYLRVFPVYAQSEVRWGLGSLVGMIDRAAQKVRKLYPDAVLSVGHLSRQGGGEIDRHASHESGRDADIGFYVRNVQGRPLLAEHFVPFRGDGTASTWPGAYFDDARNWALVRALVTDPQAHVTYIFVATPLRARLLSYAQKIGAPPEIRERAAMLMAQPRGSLPHDDHFHVRIGCPASQKECIEFPLRKKPALVAKVPVPSARTRVQPTVPRLTHVPPTKVDRSAGVDGAAKLPATEAPVITPITPPSGSLLVPTEADKAPVVPDPDSTAIDDVDGPL